MKTNCKMPWIFVLLSLLSSSVLAERTLVVEPLAAGPYAVGSMNFTIDPAKQAAAANAGVSVGLYMEGATLNGEFLYVSSLLQYPDAAFNFNLSIPNDEVRYGAVAGQQLAYAGYVLYPTSDSNIRPGYQVIDGYSLPHMQEADEAPEFADAAARYPLLVYSHGDGGDPQERVETLEKFASHGYIVLALYHGDKRFEDTDPQRFNLRSLAIKTALDRLLADTAFASHIDESKIGGWGESYGGATMLSLLGAKKVNPDAASIIADTLLEATVDTRIKAAATIYPYMGEGLYTMFGRNFTGPASVDRPFMANSGNLDTVAPFSNVRQGMENIPGVKYLIEYDKETHDFSAGAMSDALTWSKVFLDAFVKEDSAAITQLSQMASVSDQGVDSLVLVTEPAKAVTAEYAGGVLTLANLKAGAKVYSATLSLVAGTSPYEFILSKASLLDSATASDNIYTAGVLTLPEVVIGAKHYSVQLTLLTQTPVMRFKLTKATLVP